MDAGDANAPMSVSILCDHSISPRIPSDMGTTDGLCEEILSPEVGGVCDPAGHGVPIAFEISMSIY